MAKKTVKAALQYSKWLSKFICWVWAIYRFGVLIAAVLEPDAAEALASTLHNLDWIMLVNEGTYLINSLGEKYIYSDRFIFKWLETGGFKQMMARVANFKKKSEEEFVEVAEEEIEEATQEEEVEEDGDNTNG